MRSLLVIILFYALGLSISQSISAQIGKCPSIPVEYGWNNANDYEKDRDLVKKTLRWLCQTPLGEDVKQRSLANAFVLEWLAGAPNLTISVEQKWLPFLDKHEELLFVFIHGVALYKMDHPNESDEDKLYVEGYKAVVELALQSKELSHSKALHPLLKAAKKSKIKQYYSDLKASSI
jgi:hypothetical protein